MTPIMKARRVGLVFAEDHILAAEIQGGGQPRVTAVAKVGFSDAANLDDPAALGRHLRTVLRSRGFRGRRAVIGIPARWLMTRRRPVPPAEGEALAEVLRLAAERSFSVEISDLVIDFVPPPPNHPEPEVLLVAMLRRRLEQLQATAKAAGLAVEAVTPWASALSLATGSTGAELVVCLTDHTIELTLRQDRQVRLLHHIALPPGAPDPESVGGEIRRALATDVQRGPVETVERAVVWHAAQENGEAGLLTQALAGVGLQVTPSPPLETLAQVPAALKGQTQLGELMPAVAAALAGDDARLRAVDFAHPRLDPPRQRRLGRRAWIAALALMALVSVAVALLWAVHDEQTQVADLRDRLAALQPQVDAARQLVEKVDLAEGWFDRRTRALDDLKELTLLFPESGDIWATEVNLREGLAYTISGRANQPRHVLELYDRLQQSQRFEQVQLLHGREVGRDQPQVTFAFSLTARPPDQRPHQAANPPALSQSGGGR